VHRADGVVVDDEDRAIPEQSFTRGRATGRTFTIGDRMGAGVPASTLFFVPAHAEP
jgi:hypothetical protein